MKKGSCRSAATGPSGAKNEVPSRPNLSVRHGTDWFHEIKFDGYRAIARVSEGETDFRILRAKHRIVKTLRGALSLRLV